MIQTERLQLIPHSPEHLLALVDDPGQYERLAGFPLAAGLREFFVSGDVSPDWLASLRTMRGADPWRIGFAVVEPNVREMIGTGAFKGPADPNGVVEIAYGIAPGYQGQGYATEVAKALVAFAQAEESVRIVRAHTMPNANASTRVLTKCGFSFVGEVIEPEDGLVWRWELNPSAISSGVT